MLLLPMRMAEWLCNQSETKTFIFITIYIYEKYTQAFFRLIDYLLMDFTRSLKDKHHILTPLEGKCFREDVATINAAML